MAAPLRRTCGRRTGAGAPSDQVYHCLCSVHKQWKFVIPGSLDSQPGPRCERTPRRPDVGAARRQQSAGQRRNRSRLISFWSIPGVPSSRRIVTANLARILWVFADVEAIVAEIEERAGTVHREIALPLIKPESGAAFERI